MQRVVMIGPARNVRGGVSTMVNNYYAAGFESRIRLTYISTMVDGNKLRKLLQAVWAYLRFLLILPQKDILHANMSSDASYYRKKVFVDTAAFFRKKIVIHFHGGDFQTFFYQKSDTKEQYRIKKTLNKADIFIVLSPEWRDIFIPLVGADKITILRNAVQIPEIPKNDYSSHEMLFLGRLGPDKGVGELLNVMPRLKVQFPNTHLYLGGAWIDSCLEKKATGMTDYITYLGWIDKETQTKYMQKCSIFVLPSYFEGQPNSLIEAMAYGMTAVATNVGGIPQIIIDKLTGCLITPRNEEILYEALEMLLNNEDLRRQYGEAARKHIESNFNINNMVDELCKIYTSLRGM